LRDKPRMVHLARVQELDNTQKHRLVLAATSSMKMSGFHYRDETGTMTKMPEHSYAPLQEGQMMVFGDVQPNFRLPPLAHAVAFMEPGPVFGHPIGNILRNLNAMTRETVESFADCF